MEEPTKETVSSVEANESAAQFERSLLEAFPEPCCRRQVLWAEEGVQKRRAMWQSLPKGRIVAYNNDGYYTRAAAHATFTTAS